MDNHKVNELVSNTTIGDYLDTTKIDLWSNSHDGH